MIYQNVKKIADSKNISIARIEKDLGIGNGTIAKWKKAVPSVDTLKKVADYLEVSTDLLLKGYNPGQ